MANDIFLVELNDRDAFDAVESLQRIAQTRLLGRRQVDLRHVSRHDHFSAQAQTGEEHLELQRGRVLRLIEDDHRLTQRPSAHERERRNLNRPFLHVLGQLSRRNHVLQRIVQRLQVRVDLLFHVSRQESQFLARLYRRTGQDDTLHLPVLQRPHRQRNRRVGLTATRRTDRKEQVVVLVRLDQRLLVG